MKFMLKDVMWKIIGLEIPSPLSQPKASKRKLQEILKEYEFDDDFIENINVDMLKGWDAAVRIVKGLVSDEIHK